MTSNNFIVLEQALINVIDPDDHKRNEATSIIENVYKSNDCFRILMDILFQSAEPNAKKQASNQLYIMLRSKQKQIDNATEDFLKFSLINYCVQYQESSKVILNNIRECIILLVCKNHQIWAELDQFIDQCQFDLNAVRVSFLESIIHFLDVQFIMQKYQLYSQIAASAIISSNNYEIIINGISILSVLILSSGTINGFELAFAQIFLMINQYLQLQNFDDQYQTNFWNIISNIISNNIFPKELMDCIIKFITNPNNDEKYVLLALDSIEPVISSFTLDEIFSIIHQVLYFSTQYIINDNLLPKDFMGFIEKCFTYFPHLQVYEFLKNISKNILPTNPVLAILLFAPIISGAHEQVTKDIDYLIEILKIGYMSGDGLIIESCTLVAVMMNDFPQLISKCIEPLFPVILPLLFVPDSNIRSSGFTSLSQFFILSEIKNDISIVSSLWNCKANIHQDNVTQYLDLLGSAISCSEPLDDSQVHEILIFIQPMLTASSDSAYALYIIGQLISHGEYSEIESIIPSTLEAIKFCLAFDNQDVKFYALTYVAELIDSYKESITDILNAIWPLIEQIILKKKFTERIMELALLIASGIAVLFKQQNIIQEILLSLNRVYKKKFYIAYLKACTKLVKVVDDNVFDALMVRVINICINDDDIETVKLCFRALEKFLKYTPEGMRNKATELSVGLIKSFFEGTLQCLDNQSILNLQQDIDTGLIDYASDFISKFVSFPSPYVEQVCLDVLKISNRNEDEYKNFVVQILIDAIENRTVPESFALQLAENLEPFLTTQDEGIQQSIVYLMIVILDRYPTFIETLGKYIPFISNWWMQCMTNTTQYSLLISNIASLFLRLECLTSNIPYETLEQLMDFFPPSDLTETQGMSDSILKIFANAASNEKINEKINTPNFRLKTAIGLGKLLTEPAKKVRKINMSQETKDRILVLFRILCQDQQIAQAVIESLAKNEKRKLMIINIMQS